MNEYLKAFQNIALSSEALLTDESNSQEIKLSADRLKASVQPCFEELNQSAIRLKKFIQGCLVDLDRAEDVWNSKPRIAAEPKDKIWEQLGELSGYHFEIQRLGNRYKYESVKLAKQNWEEKIDSLRKKWFIDPKTKLPRTSIGWGDKDGFIKDIRAEFDSQSLIERMRFTINVAMNLIKEKANSIDLYGIERCANLFDKIEKSKFNNKIELIESGIKIDFANTTSYLDEKLTQFKSDIRSALNELVKKPLGEISWVEVNNFKKEVTSKIEDTVNSIFDEKIKSVTKAIEEAIAFYNEFLERQERYQQETPEQRQAEKDWIDKQRQELEQLQKGIELIINPFAR